MSVLSFRRRRASAGLLAGTLIAALLPAPAVAAVTSTEPPASYAAARALAGDHVAARFAQTASPGAATAADVIFALAGTGGHADAVADALAVLGATTPAYIGQPGAVTNAGGLGKVMLAVQVAGGDPTAFAGYDLEAELRQRIGENGAIGGVNLFAAPLALSALARTEGGVPAATATWFAAQRCADEASANFGAYGWQGGGCGDFVIDVDTTAVALQVLVATGLDAVAADAATWLLGKQSDDLGGFPGAAGPDNANSTGLAGQALRAYGATAAAARAAEHVVSLQFGEDADPAHVGGFRLRPGNAAPNLMATHQAVLALDAPAFHELTAAVDDPNEPADPTDPTDPTDPSWADGWCEGTEGVSIAVDFHGLDPDRFADPVVRCATGDHADGFSVLDAAGFDTETIFGGGFLCTVEGLPIGGTDAGGNGCLYDGYWSYWHADADDLSWTYSQLGAGNRTPAPGSAEGWSWTVIVDGDISGRPLRTGPFDVDGGDDDGGAPVVRPVAPVNLDADLVAAGEAAGGWLGRQLVDGPLGDPQFPDWGLTLDAVLGLAATGVGADVATTTIERLRDTAAGQLYPTFNAGAAAKTLLGVHAVGENPSTYLDVDLEASVRGAMDGDGRFQHQTSFGQSLAILALATTTDGVPDAAVDWLLSVQCDDGAFHGASCTRPDADHTGLAVQALLVSGSSDPAVADAVADAAAWLSDEQAADGSFDITFDGTTFTPNTNSTGLGGQALRALGDGDAADAAGRFVTGRQLTCTAFDVSDALAADDLGAIAYGQAGHDGAIADGITAVTRDQFQRATPQALLTLGAPVLSALTFDGADAALPATPDCDDGDGDGGDGGEEPSPRPTPPYDRGIDRVCDASPQTGFTDLAGWDAHARAMACLEGFGITQGTSDATRFRPGSDVTRAQLASFLDRLLRTAGRPLAGSSASFDDVAADDVHADAIARLAAAGIVEGRGDGRFVPGRPVTRAQAASMLARTLDVLDDGLRNGSAPEPGEVDAFPDDRGLVHEPAIDALAAVGVVQGRADGTFGPDTSIRRAQMASLLLRALDLAVETGSVDPVDLP